MILKYINSKGIEVDFLGSIRLKDANFSTYEWEYDYIEQQHGISISKFKKSAKNFELTALFTGSVNNRKKRLNEFTNTVEYDVLQNSAGVLIHGDDYINCFIIASSNEPQQGNTSTQKTFTMLAPYPFWIEEASRSFFPVAAGKATGFLDYNYDYNYNYTQAATGNEVWNIEHYAPCKFKLTVYGPVSNPRIIINDNVYEVDDTLENHDYIVIDSFKNQKNTITKFTSSGQQLNLLNLRYKKSSVFTPIFPNNIKINWNGTFGFDLTLYLERSEPRWI